LGWPRRFAWQSTILPILSLPVNKFVGPNLTKARLLLTEGPFFFALWP
jgi:hypothetical protein